MSGGLSRSVLVLGGARSGKTRHAMALTEAASALRTYVATAQAFDDEMAARIDRHKAERGEGWHTVEAPLDVVGALRSIDSGAVLVDCLTLWLSNLMHDGADVTEAAETLFAAVDAFEGPTVLVSNEVGLSIVPETPLGRQFRDLQGLLNQQVAAAVGRVDFVAAGLPMRLKG